MNVLDDDVLATELATRNLWALLGGQLHREIVLPDFRSAVALVVRIGFAAEAANHHPDIDIRYNRVVLLLSTHSAGGITTADLALADAIDEITPGA